MKKPTLLILDTHTHTHIHTYTHTHVHTHVGDCTSTDEKTNFAYTRRGYIRVGQWKWIPNAGMHVYVCLSVCLSSVYLSTVTSTVYFLMVCYEGDVTSLYGACILCFTTPPPQGEGPNASWLRKISPPHKRINANANASCVRERNN
jgi:hypothetical protein